jgi:hypothetical protein
MEEAISLSIKIVLTSTVLTQIVLIIRLLVNLPSPVPDVTRT